jgi:hypothetical protein
MSSTVVWGRPFALRGAGRPPLPLVHNPAGGVNVVAMDDFIYSEPAAAPEPASLALMGLGLAGIVVHGFCRRKLQNRRSR